MWPVMGSGYCRFEAFPSLRCSSTQYKLQHSPMTTCPTFPHLQRAPGSRQRRRQHKPWVAHTCDVFCGIVLDAVLTAQARPLFTRIRIFLPGGMDYSHAWQHIVTAHDRHMSTTQVECWIIDAAGVHQRKPDVTTTTTTTEMQLRRRRRCKDGDAVVTTRREMSHYALLHCSLYLAYWEIYIIMCAFQTLSTKGSINVQYIGH
ncbi:hypothetical protein EDB85DRAFT_1902584 [Lactarius pseudohatsudake]|nr:hypothetical protein EDB85DRAFT_1902584 [Lactarius pseudohatsudake]